MKLNPENAKELISILSEHGLIIYGMGYVGGLIADWCDNNGITYIYADKNAVKKKQGNKIPVITPEQLENQYQNYYIVVASINYYDEIVAQLKEMNIMGNRVLSYIRFWTKKFAWNELENTVNWEEVKQRAEIFAKWIDATAVTVTDYSYEKNYLKDFLASNVVYDSPNYIQLIDNIPHANLQALSGEKLTDVSYCMAMLMSFDNPLELITYMCVTTRQSIVVSYVTLECLPNINFRRSINYNNDFSENQLLALFETHGFVLKRKGTDPFDAVNTIYLFRKGQL